MSVIYSYPNNVNILATDIIIGSSTKVVNGKKKNVTKNFEVGNIAEFYNEISAIAIAGQNNFFFQNNIAPGRKQGSITFISGGGAGTSFGSITTLRISKFATSGNSVANYLTTLVDQAAIIAQCDNLNNFGIYKVISITTVIDNPNFVDVVIQSVNANGSILADKFYTFAVYPGFVNPNIDPVGVYDFISPLVNTDSVVTVNQSSTITDGYLSATDWNTFNNKQSGITLTTTGTSGVATFIGNVLNIPDYGSGYIVPTLNQVVSIGNTADQDIYINGITLGRGTGNSLYNTAVGASALINNTTGNYNTSVGAQSLRDNLGGNYNVANGYATLRNNLSGNYNVAIGLLASTISTTGASNTSIGAYSLYRNLIGSFNTAVGYRVLENNVADKNTAIGAETMFSNTSGTFNTAVGQEALRANTTGNYNVSIGNFSLLNSLSNYVSALGRDAGRYSSAGNLNTATESVFIGYSSKSLNTSSTNEIVIGANAVGEGNNTVTLGSSAITSTRLRGAVKGGSFVKDGGTSSQFLMADGSVTTGGSQDLNSVLTVGDSSLLNANIGQLGLYDTGAGGYSTISSDSRTFFFNDYNGLPIFRAEPRNITIFESPTIEATLRTSLLTASRLYQLPNAAGTIALTSDIPSLVGYVQTTRTLTINGTAYDLSANRTWDVGSVTSVGLSMPSAFNVSSSPITGSGTLTVTGAGTTAQYIRGDGTLATFPSLTGYVPYTGATSDVNLGVHGLLADKLSLNTAPTQTLTAAGQMIWNNTDGTLDIRLKGNNVTLQVGEEQVLRAVNKSGADLLEANFQAVRVRSVAEGGASGQRLAVVLAQADSDADSATTIGLVTETINNNQEGFITTSGEVKEIDTTGAKSYGGLETWVDGDMLFLDPYHAGYLTNVKPFAPNHLIVIGYVVYAHAIHGKIFVKVDNGYELDELHNVYINPATLADGDLIQYDSATSVWENKSLSAAGIQPTITLTTTGTSGAATLVGSTLNIPQYSGGGGGSTPVKLTSQTLTEGSWALVGSYYTYAFSNVNVTTTCDVSVTPQNASYLTAYNAQVLPFVDVAAGVATFYSQFPPQDDMVVDIVITQTT